MTIFEEYPVTITASELKTATGLDLVEEMEQAEIAPFLQKVCLSVYEGGIYATGDRELKDRIISAHYEKAETAIKRALIIQAEYEHGVGRIGTESGITITAARTRFGSCSPKNRLCFSWRLMAYPEEAIDYVVVHELAHLVHRNHGPEFYALVASILPDHKQRRALLK